MTAGESKTRDLTRALLRRIRRSRMAPGTKLASEAQLAERYGVSRVTVRRAIRELTRQGILESRAGVGHIVQSHQPALRIGLLVGNAVFTPFQQAVLNAFEKEMTEAGFRTRLYVLRLSGLNGQRDTRPVIQDIRAGELAGVLAVSWSAYDGEHSTELVNAMAECDVPYVALTSHHTVAAVSENLQSQVYDTTDHLLRSGRRRIALVPPASDSSCEIALDAWRAAHATHRLSAAPELVLPHRLAGETAGFEGFNQWWQTRPDADALIVMDDYHGKGMLTAARFAGVDLHRQLRMAILWIKGSNLFMPGPFVRVELDPAGMVQHALRILRYMMDGAPPPPRVLVPCRVIDDQAQTPVASTEDTHAARLPSPGANASN
ncbi:MAG: GntR family transcriptional regulator [Phycisphaeraceae bacterium]